MNEAKKIQRLLVAIIFICLTVILICLLGGCSTKGHVDAAANQGIRPARASAATD